MAGAISPVEILNLSRAVLNGTHAIPTAHVSRAAALLARQALEDSINDLCDSAGASMRTARTRSRLVSLRILVGNEVADLAAVAWGSLSNVCHHHAYELTPTAGEIQHLIDLVDRLTALAPTTTHSAGAETLAHLPDVAADVKAY